MDELSLRLIRKLADHAFDGIACFCHLLKEGGLLCWVRELLANLRVRGVPFDGWKEGTLLKVLTA